MTNHASQPDEASLREATKLLECCGYRVERVPVADEPRPDLIATTDNELLAVEVKSNESVQLIFDELGVATLSIELVESNTLSRVVRKAASQLRNGPDEALRLICYVAGGMEAEAKLSQLRATLYGLVDVIEFPKTTRVIPCFYFDHSAFFRNDCISGALLVQGRGAQLCVNAFAPRRADLQASKLYETLAQGNAVRDPIDEENKGQAYSICDAIDRRDDNVRLEYLSKKYSTGKLLTLRWNANIGVGQIPMAP